MTKQTVLATKGTPWRVARTIKNAQASASTVDAVLVASDFDMGWANRKAANFIPRGRIHKEDKRVPNNVAIATWLEGTAPTNTVYQYRVDVIAGPNNNADRMCNVIASTGDYRISVRANGVACPAGSGRYAKGGVVTKYGNNIGVIDFDRTSGGKGYITFDVMGDAEIAVNLISTIPAGAVFGVEMRGW